MKKYLLESLALNLLCYALIGVTLAFVLLVSGALMPVRSSGSILYLDGTPVGAERIAQGFSQPEFLWPRSSAVDYDGAGSGGSHLSPASPEFRQHAILYLSAYEQEPVPVELVTTSGSGLDPHISLAAARYQWPRIAARRGLENLALEEYLEENPEVLDDEDLVNVLKFNISLIQNDASTESL